tara:strand:- start:6100 stop:6729 length:630 start_codon:yes stop_codon:yes gene_type:complete
MNARIAKKVISRFATYPANYTRDQINAAYSILGRDVDERQIAIYEAAIKARKDETAARQASAKVRAAANAEKRAAAAQRAEAKKAEKERRVEVGRVAEAKKAQIAENLAAANAEAKEKAEAKKKAEAAAKAKAELPQETVVPVGAVEAKIEAGEDGVLGTDDDKVTLQKAGTDLASKSVSELKALCKKHGIKGYSKLKKDELLAALDGL